MLGAEASRCKEVRVAWNLPAVKNDLTSIAEASAFEWYSGPVEQDFQ